jgi:HSP20 family molecular chaperone IbpA
MRNPIFQKNSTPQNLEVKPTTSQSQTTSVKTPTPVRTLSPTNENSKEKILTTPNQNNSNLMQSPTRGYSIPIIVEDEIPEKPKDENPDGIIQIKLLQIPEHRVLDQPDRWIIAVALKGTNRDKIKLKLSKHTLTITAPLCSTETEKRVCLYEKKLEIPKSVDLSTIQYEAKFENGILIIEVMKNPTNSPAPKQLKSPISTDLIQNIPLNTVSPIPEKPRKLNLQDVPYFNPRVSHQLPHFTTQQNPTTRFKRLPDLYYQGHPHSNLCNDLFRTFWNDDYFNNDDDIFNYLPRHLRKPIGRHHESFPIFQSRWF